MGKHETKRVIFDCDMTMGVPGCDVDDGLALLMLLGEREACTIEGITVTYGNSDIDTTFATAHRIVNELALDIPVLKGTPAASDDPSPAARFLAEKAAAEPKTISILATGSLSNLRGAAALDRHFFENLRGITAMGGITRSLIINGRIMDELNLSCDPHATYLAIDAANKGCPVTIATAQNCLPAHFFRQDFIDLEGPGSWLVTTCDYWFTYMEELYAWNGFACWDVVAAAALVRPDLFIHDQRAVTLDERLFSVGMLDSNPMEGAPSACVDLPCIADASAFKREVLASWARALS